MGLAHRCSTLARDAGLVVYDVVDPASLCRLLEQLRRQRQARIWMLAGDGTIQALAQYFAARPPDDWTPAMLFLAGGRANIVPRECGGYPALPAMRRALAALAAGRPLRQQAIRALRVEQEGSPPRQGFLLAGAVIHEGVRLCAAHREAGSGWLHRSFFADPYVLLKLWLQVLAGRSPLPPYPEAEARLEGIGELSGPMRILLATSLELGNALYNPFAGRGSGPVRLTAVAADAPYFWRHLPALLRGRFDNNMDQAQGFLSGHGQAAQLRGIGGYALDGELVEADPALPIRILPGITLQALHA